MTAATTTSGVHYAHCAACGWFDIYRTLDLAREKLATHRNYEHHGFGCRPGGAR